MFYSYVMGIDESIFDLKQHGFIIEQDKGSNYMISFDEKYASEWESFISKHLEEGYWNEYLANDKVVFIFHLEDGFRRYVVEQFENDEVLSLCERLCKSKFESLKSMLIGNHFYKDKIV